MSDHLKEIKAMGLPVTWATIRAGWDGIGCRGRQLTIADVATFACEQLENATTAMLPDIADLCAAADEDACETALGHLAPRTYYHAIRTWRAYQLAQLLKSLPESPVDGLSELTSFWNDLDFPEDMPHVVQGLGNEISPAEYYTEENYRYLVHKHQQWLQSEISGLKREMTSPN
jgi:hypothetical protein